MIEAILLAAILSGMLILLLGIRRASQLGAPQTLGLLAFISVENDLGTQTKKKVKPRA